MTSLARNSLPWRVAATLAPTPALPSYTELIYSVRREVAAPFSFPSIHEKPIGWRGSALDDLRRFPDEARRDAGYQLHLLQEGKSADDWRPMSDVGPGTIEVRLHSATEHRVFVVAKFNEAIYVLHAFQKKSERTSRHDLQLAKRRYRDLTLERLTR